MNTNKRRGVTSNERKTPCHICKHPVSQRHHLLHVAVYGENDFTVNLCANCHEMFHLAYQNAKDTRNGKLSKNLTRNGNLLPKSTFLWGHIILKFGFDNERIHKILDLVYGALDLEQQIRDLAEREGT